MCRSLSSTYIWSGKCAGTFPAHIYEAANVQEPFRHIWSGKCAGTFPANVQEPFRHIWSGKCAGTFPAKCAGTFPAHMDRQVCRNLSGKCAGTFPAHMERLFQAWSVYMQESLRHLNLNLAQVDKYPSAGSAISPLSVYSTPLLWESCSYKIHLSLNSCSVL